MSSITHRVTSSMLLLQLLLLHTVTGAPPLQARAPAPSHGVMTEKHTCERYDGHHCVKETKCESGLQNTDLTCPGNRVCCVPQSQADEAAKEWYPECGESMYEDACSSWPAHIPGLVQPSNITGMIVGGVEARQGELPWQVLITHSRVVECGGTLIDERWVLTAAHCLWDTDISNYRAVLGEHDRDDSDNSNRQYSAFVSVHIHPSYNRNTKANDIALIKLAVSLPITDYIRPACPPGDLLASYVGEHCIVSGWGLMGTTEGNAVVLRYAGVPVIDTATCRAKYQGIGKQIHEHNLCAGEEGGGKDACTGDSGGPLVCNVNGLFQLVGVVSWGKDCGDANYPGVYTAVPYFLTWIQMVRAA